MTNVHMVTHGSVPHSDLRNFESSIPLSPPWCEGNPNVSLGKLCSHDLCFAAVMFSSLNFRGFQDVPPAFSAHSHNLLSFLTPVGDFLSYLSFPLGRLSLWRILRSRARLPRFGWLFCYLPF